MLWSVVAFESSCHLGPGALDAAVAQCRELLAVALAGEDRTDDPHPAVTRHVAEHLVELDVHLFERLVHELDLLAHETTSP